MSWQGAGYLAGPKSGTTLLRGLWCIKNPLIPPPDPADPGNVLASATTRFTATLMRYVAFITVGALFLGKAVAVGKKERQGALAHNWWPQEMSPQGLKIVCRGKKGNERANDNVSNRPADEVPTKR